VKACNYLIKPVTEADLTEALDEILGDRFQRRDKSAMVRTKEGVTRIAYDSIMYVALNRRALSYHLTSGRCVESIQIRTTFSEAVQELLKDARFVLCGASIAVNLHYVTMVEKDALLLKEDCKIFIPRKSSSAVRSAWYDYWFEGGGNP